MIIILFAMNSEKKTQFVEPYKGFMLDIYDDLYAKFEESIDNIKTIDDMCNYKFRPVSRADYMLHIKMMKELDENN
jgi:hypothetical protein